MEKARLAALIDAARDEAGWSLTRLGAELGVTEQAARKWASGASVPSGDTLLLLIERLPGLRERLGFSRIAA